MSGKDPSGVGLPPQSGNSNSAQITPVDLATKTPTVAQIRIPSVPTALRPALINSRLAGSNQHLRPQLGPGSPRTTAPLAKAPTGASITMLPGTGKVTVVPASMGQIITPRSAAPGIRQSLSTRPILAQPAPTRPSTIAPQARAAVATPILRGVTPISGTHALTLRAPLPQNLTGSIRLASPQVQWVQTTPSNVSQQGPVPRATSQTTRPINSARPPTVLPVGSRTVTMAAVSFRPTGPLVTQTRPMVSPTAGGGVTLVQTGTKTIVTQNPAGIFKPITTQVSVPGQPVAVKPAAVSNTIPVRVPAGQRVSMVPGTPLAVSLTQAPTHIQVPIVPGAVGPSKARVAVPAQSIQKLVSGNMGGLSMGMMGQVSVAPVQLSQGQTVGARTIQLPYSGQQAKTGTPPSTSIPVARVIPQPSVSRDQQGLAVSAGYVVAGTFLSASRPMDSTSQAGPVNLTVSDRSAFSRGAVAPAMSLPNFTHTTFLYEAGRAEQSSVTITTLPAPSEGLSGQNTANQHHGPATITPARITPILPPGSGTTSQGDQEKTVPGSPRPSILRKRPEGDLTPMKGTQLLTSPGSPPRPDSSGSSTISATSSLPALSGDEQPPPTPTPTIEPSPRKKPRKQQLPPRETTTNISPEWAAVKRELGARDRLEWNTRPEPDWEGRVRNWNSSMWQGSGQGEGMWDQDMNQDQADDEDEMSSDDEREKQPNFIQGKPHMSLLNSYRHTWKSRHNHFLRYSDVKSKDERRPTVNELANQKLVLQKINGWKIYHLSASMEDIVDMESELSKRLQDVGRRLEEAANKDVSKELIKVQELIKANIQRSKVIQDQVSEAKDNSQSIFEHKPKIQDIIVKYQSKRSLKGRRDN